VAGTNVHWWPPITCTGLSAATSIPVRSFALNSSDVVSCSTSPCWSVTVPAPLVLRPAMDPAMKPLSGPAASDTVVLSSLATTAKKPA
jgi:hypothetical protein